MMQALSHSTMRAALVAVALACGTASAGAQAPAAPAASDAAAKTLRPEVATPVNAAQEAARAGQKEQAETKLREAAAVPNLTMFEQAVIERGRASVSLSGRDWTQAIRSLEVVVASNQFGGADQLQMVELLAKLNYQEKDYLRAVSWLRRYLQEGGNDAALRELLPQALYLANEHKAAAEELETRIGADEAAGRTPSEQTLRLLISSYVQGKDDTGYVRALERMAMSYPKPEYWTELLSRVTKQPGFSERLWLDVYRLRYAANLMRNADEYVEMAQLALNAGYPAEALRVIDRGLSLSLLGNGKDAANHGALRERASKAVEKDSADLPRAESSARSAREGDALVNVGFVHVTAGTPAKGVPLMEQGLAKGNLRRADEARLHLGLALWQAGRKDDAVKALADVKGNDGSANLARVWSVFVRSPAGKV
jgi:tetratricopeptide (TPR) repeat protein